MVCILAENQNQSSFSPFGQQKISVLFELLFGHLRYYFTDVPPQPNSPTGNVGRKDYVQSAKDRLGTVPPEDFMMKNHPTREMYPEVTTH